MSLRCQLLFCAGFFCVFHTIDSVDMLFTAINNFPWFLFLFLHLGFFISLPTIHDERPRPQVRHRAKGRRRHHYCRRQGFFSYPPPASEFEIIFLFEHSFPQYFQSWFFLEIYLFLKPTGFFGRQRSVGSLLSIFFRLKTHFIALHRFY